MVFVSALIASACVLIFQLGKLAIRQQNDTCRLFADLGVMSSRIATDRLITEVTSKGSRHGVTGIAVLDCADSCSYWWGFDPSVSFVVKLLNGSMLEVCKSFAM